MRTLPLPLVLRHRAELAQDMDCPLSIKFRCFWQGFTDFHKESMMKLIELLFTGIGIKKPIEIISVFNVGREEKDLFGRLQTGYLEPNEQNKLYVSFSGEPFSTIFKYPGSLNLIMDAETAPNIIAIPLFAISVYELGVWDYLSVPRPIYPLSRQKFCAFIVRNGHSVRTKFMNMLSQYRKVDCAGTFMNNTGFLAPEGDVDYRLFLQEYKFIICFENTKQTNYVTEKLFNAYMGGCIPIYWGSDQVKEWFNPKAFLTLDCTESTNSLETSMQMLVEKIRILDTNPELYAAMQQEPLLRSRDIPEPLQLDRWKSRISDYLKEHRPDMFKESI